MHYAATLLLTLISATSVIAKQDTTATDEGPWPTYGYIALGAIILLVAIVVLIRKQYRKFNE